MNGFSDAFAVAQQWLFEALVQPIVFHLGMGNLLEDAFTATGWLLVGLLQLAIMLAVIAPLQRIWPAEAVEDPAAVRTDMLYTVLHRLGLFRVAFFLLLEPLFDDLFGMLRVAGWHTLHIDGLIGPAWPGVLDHPVASLLLYLVVFDFIDYWLHRAQHRFGWWWSLHALHHSQRQMTMWSDNRNHLVDDLLRDAVLVLVAQAIGVAPGQFIAIVAITQLCESLQHANLRLSFGRWGERLWVSPRFHRVHHSIGLGHESPVRTPARSQAALAAIATHEATARRAAGPPQGAAAPPGGSEPREAGSVGATFRRGHNFGVLLPWWDMLFRTGNFEPIYPPTGIRDQVEPGPDGRVRDYGRGFWAQQWLGLRRLIGRG